MPHKLSDLDEYSAQFAEQELVELWKTFDAKDLLRAGQKAGVLGWDEQMIHVYDRACWGRCNCCSPDHDNCYEDIDIFYVKEEAPDVQD